MVRLAAASFFLPPLAGHSRRARCPPSGFIRAGTFSKQKMGVIGTLDAATEVEFRSPPYGPDWVLALEDPDAGYPPPGLKPWKQ